MIKKLFLLAAIASLGLFVPVQIDVTEASPTQVVRVAEACGQATECEQRRRYICVGNQDHIDYRCSKGCDEAEA